MRYDGAIGRDGLRQRAGRGRWLGLVVVLAVGLGCERPDLPDPSSPAYREAVTAFYASLAALQASEDLGAEDRLVRVTELAPSEPAAWANLGLLSLRRGELAAARERLEQARQLAPDNVQIQVLLAQLARAEGRFDDALAFLRQAHAHAPGNLKAAYLLLEHLERTRPESYEAAVREVVDALLMQQPDNLVLRLDRIRIAGRGEDWAVVQADLEHLAGQADAWPPEAQDYLERLQTAAADRDPATIGTQVAFLRNALLPTPRFRRDLNAVRTPPEEVGDLLTSFVRLPDPRPEPASPDAGLSFVETPIPDAEGWVDVGVVWRTGEEAPELIGMTAEALYIDGGVLWRPGTMERRAGPAIAALDVDYDFDLDLAVVGSDGLRLFQQDSTGAHLDGTAALGLPGAVASAAYTGIWAVDVDLEGDMDLVLSRPGESPLLLRNNGDQTFTPQPFVGGTGMRDLAWVDLDRDGDPDLVVLQDTGPVQVYWNERQGIFRPAPDPPAALAAQAVTVADWDADGRFEVLGIAASGSVWRLSWQDAERGWHYAEILATEALDAEAAAFLTTADLDNNGALDLLVGTPQETRVWLAEAAGRAARPPITVPGFVRAVADRDGDGRLDLVGRQPDGVPVGWRTVGTVDYHWQMLRPRAAQTLGDQRINSYGIGGIAEVRAGLLYQQRLITAPVVHLGLGTHEQVDLLRLIWPNGNVQAEFDLAADQAVLASQRLKGSCPWLFAFDGTQMQFVTDILWRSPLGLRINAQETAGVLMTEDWVRVRGDQLQPRGGVYDLRITAELWETHFFDHVALLAVDHPADLDVLVDERFVVPPQPWQVQALTPPRPLAQAWDHDGRDVTDRLRVRDGRYVGPSVLGPYQGVAQEHTLEIDLGAEAAAEPNLRLVATGWTRPTDSSINVALSQGTHSPPQSLSLEVPDGQGGWRTVQTDLGFPAGKAKTIVLDLADVFAPGTPRRLRLRTNLEIYWDAVGWAGARPDAPLRVEQRAPTGADLRYRGFSAVSEADRSSPELPDYRTLAGTAPRWQDLVGFHTRFGDVRTLLEGVDDRYVIMNAGDELRLAFPALPPPADGWRRTFVFVSDGWVKDGDWNTTFSKTVRPLPAHGQPAYATPPGPLAENPVYQQHAEDWATFHTRYVTPERWRSALVPR